MVDRRRPRRRRLNHLVAVVAEVSLWLPAGVEAVVEAAPLPLRFPSVAVAVVVEEEVARLQQPLLAVAAVVVAQFQFPVVEQEEVLAQLRLLAWRAICVHILHILPSGLWCLKPLL